MPNQTIDLSRGLEGNRPAWTQYTDIELLQEVRRVAKIVGANPSSDEFDEHSQGPNSSTLSNRFGSWVKAKEMAGVGGHLGHVDINTSYFAEIDSHEKAYYLGLLFADGSLTDSCGQTSITITLQKQDEGIIEDMKEDFDSGHKLQHIEYENENHSNQTKLSITDRKFCEHLRQAGIDERKSNTDGVPEIDVCYRPAFLRGLSDGDGCMTSYERHGETVADWQITNNSESRLQTFSEWVRAWGVDSISIHEGSRGSYVMKVGAPENVRRVWRTLYPAGVETYPAMDRKVQKFRSTIEVLN